MLFLMLEIGIHQQILVKPSIVTCYGVIWMGFLLDIGFIDN
jgi:hypothetical protein